MHASQPRLELATVVSKPFSENTYIAHLAGRPDCLVFDPGFEPDKILRYLEARGLSPAAILLTHGHPDHIAGVGALKDQWPDCPIVIGRNDAAKLTDPELNLSAEFGMPLVFPPADRLLDDGDLFQGAGFDLEVREIPGHSTGHVVFIWNAGVPIHVFGGDVLFAGSVGRTDLPGGSFEDLAGGIHRVIFALPDDTIVLPGHGPRTTVGAEKRANPFVGRPSGWRT